MTTVERRCWMWAFWKELERLEQLGLPADVKYAAYRASEFMEKIRAQLTEAQDCNWDDAVSKEFLEVFSDN